MERIIFIIVIYIGDALLAIAFGIIAANSTLLPEKFNNLFKNIRKITAILSNKYNINIPTSLMQRFE